MTATFWHKTKMTSTNFDDNYTAEKAVKLGSYLHMLYRTKALGRQTSVYAVDINTRYIQELATRASYLRRRARDKELLKNELDFLKHFLSAFAMRFGEENIETNHKWVVSIFKDLEYKLYAS